MDRLLVGALATWELLELWHHGSVFASWRARVELWDNKLGQLLRCMFCAAPWASWLFVLPPLFLEIMPWTYLVYGLAVARLANLGNDLTHFWCRTPKSETPMEAVGRDWADEQAAMVAERALIDAQHATLQKDLETNG